MTRRIEVMVGRDGRLQIEYTGFHGDTCYDEAEALQKALRTMGLWAIPVTVTPKSPSQIELEVGAEETPQRKVPLS